jgi:hypothetical protein
VNPGTEFLCPPRRKILPLLQSGAISYTLPGFRYAPPWAKVYRHLVAQILCKGLIETFTPGWNSDWLLRTYFWTLVIRDRSCWAESYFSACSVKSKMDLSSFLFH